MLFLESRHITDIGYIIIKLFSLHSFAKECISISLRYRNFKVGAIFVYREESGAYPSRRAIRVMGQYTGLHNAAPTAQKHIHQDHIYC
jgi:hypothetical protein